MLRLSNFNLFLLTLLSSWSWGIAILILFKLSVVFNNCWTLDPIEVPWKIILMLWVIHYYGCTNFCPGTARKSYLVLHGHIWTPSRLHFSPPHTQSLMGSSLCWQDADKLPWHSKSGHLLTEEIPWDIRGTLCLDVIHTFPSQLLEIPVHLAWSLCSACEDRCLVFSP